MYLTRVKKISFLLLTLALILACSPFAASTPQPEATLNALYTSAAQTLGALSTEGANTLTAQPLSTGTLFIATSSAMPLSTFTPVPPLQPLTQCDAASFVADVTFPDGSVVSRGNSFTKIWRIKNIGTCTWSTSYSLVFVSGERFGAPTAVSLPGSIGPGQTVDLSVNMTAPGSDGHFKGYWKLRNSSGILFGVGTEGDSSFYVDINVTGYTVFAYDFISSYCDAVWTNYSNNLNCPGVEGDSNGFVQVLNSPQIENGTVQEKALLTYPPKSTTGFISGKYPGIDIQTGDHFQALITCEYKANDCDALFRLSYQVGKDPVRTLGEWHEIYEGQYYSINVDLSSLSGQKVKIILTVFSNGNSHEDFALWVAPRITRQSAHAPAPTSTPTLSPAKKPPFTFTPTATP